MFVCACLCVCVFFGLCCLKLFVLFCLFCWVGCLSFEVYCLRSILWAKLYGWFGVWGMGVRMRRRASLMIDLAMVFAAVYFHSYFDYRRCLSARVCSIAMLVVRGVF